MSPEDEFGFGASIRWDDESVERSDARKRILNRMPTNSLIQIEKLSKRYGNSKTYALKDVSLAVTAGEVYGFLGSNGAGKSTTIRALLGFLQPTGGSATICGLDMVRDTVEVKRHVGYLAGDVALYKKMTGHDLLAYLQQLQPLKHQAYYQELISRFNADLSKPIDELSKGNRQKIGLIQAFMHEPEVLILDEPTSGLDPLMQEAFYELIDGCKQRGAAVFVSSHNLDEVQRMCDRVGIVRAGELVSEQTVSELNAQNAQRFTVVFNHQTPTNLSHVSGLKVDSQQDAQAVVSIKGSLQPFLAFLAKHQVISLSSRQTNLEEEFLQFYGDKS